LVRIWLDFMTAAGAREAWENIDFPLKNPTAQCDRAYPA
jgi:hypothetical protein